MKLLFRRITFTLHHPFTISGGSTAARDSVLVAVEHDGAVGLGEAAPVKSYGQSADSVVAAMPAAGRIVAESDPFASELLADRLLAALPGQPATVAAVDMAVHDLAGQLAGLPVWRRLGVPADRMPLNSLSIGIDSIDQIERKVREATSGERGPAWPILKIKLGTERDEEIIAAVRRCTAVPLRVDANGGWDLERARRMCRWLGQPDRNVEMIEQPLPRGRERELAELKACSPVPIYADESCHSAADAVRLAGCVHGVNLKLSKAGGVTAGLRLIHAARAAGLGVMVGCQIESSIGIAAAAQLAPLCDLVDLDAHLLLARDTAAGLAIGPDGRLILSARPGLGVTLRDDLADLKDWSAA